MINGDRSLLTRRTADRAPCTRSLRRYASGKLPYIQNSLSGYGSPPATKSHIHRDLNLLMRGHSLLKILEVNWNARTEDAWKPHPMFGKMTPKEWGKLLQIHVDYHLRQFAA